MKKSELKKLIKPLVKECVQESIHEVLFESGVVAQVVTEVIKGVNIPQLVESMAPKAPVVREVPAPVQMTEVVKQAPQMATVVGGGNINAELEARRAEHKAQMAAQQERLEESLGSSLGINVFENTTPALPEVNESQNPLGGVDPGDPGVNLSAIPGLTTLDYSRHLKG